MSNEDIIRALKRTNAQSELVEDIVAALDDLDRMYQMEAEAVSQAHALGAAIESANLWTEIAERLEAKYEVILSELATALNYIAIQDAENAALRKENDGFRARLDAWKSR